MLIFLVTVDCTWQRRGHTSKIGVVFVISVPTGEVLDFAVKPLVCHECVPRSKMESTKFKEWYKSHEGKCSINHKGSSDAMEAAGATEIFFCVP